MNGSRAIVVAGALVLCGSALVLSACGDDGEEVAFGGNCVWDFDELPLQEGDAEGSVRLAIDAACDYSGTGFGDLSGVGTAYITAPDVDGDVLFSSDIVYTDEDGDTIEGAMDGVGSYGAVGAQLSFYGVENFGDGTGSFAGATGAADAEGELDLEAGDGSYATDGAIVLVD